MPSQLGSLGSPSPVERSPTMVAIGLPGTACSTSLDVGRKRVRCRTCGCSGRRRSRARRRGCAPGARRGSARRTERWTGRPRARPKLRSTGAIRPSERTCQRWPTRRARRATARSPARLPMPGRIGTDWGAGTRTRIAGSKGRSLAIRRPPNCEPRRSDSGESIGGRSAGALLPCGRDRTDRRHPRRRAGDAHALRRRPRSCTPLCGRPMVAVADARRARGRRGPGRRRRRPGAARSRRACPTASRSPCSASPTAPATRCSPPPREIDPDAPVIVLSGDVPLSPPAAIAALADDARGGRRRRHDGHDGPRRPDRLRPRRARRRRPRRARRRDEGRRATPRAEELADPRGQHRHLRLRRRRRCVDALGAGLRPTTPRASATCPTCCRCCASSGPRRRRPRSSTIPALTLGRQRPRRPRRACARSPSARIHERHMRAGVTIVDPALHVDRRRRRDRRRTR